MAARKDLAGVAWHEHSAPADAALNDEDAWRAANPGLGVVKSEAYMRAAASRAAATPGDEAGFRALDLNQPRSPTRELIVSLADWQACCDGAPPDRRGPAVVGIDAGGSTSMTAAAVYWPACGRLEVWAGLPNVPTLAEREAADRVAPGTYSALAARGELALYPGRVTPVAAFIRDMAARLRGGRVICIGADRYRQAELVQAFEAADVRWPIGRASWRGTGAGATADGSADVRAFQRAVLEGRLRLAAGHGLMALAIAESEIRHDVAGNPALAKGRHRGRIDALQAAVIAVGLGSSWRPGPRIRWEFPGGDVYET